MVPEDIEESSANQTKSYPYPEPPIFGWYPEDFAWGREHGLDDAGEPLRSYAPPVMRDNAHTKKLGESSQGESNQLKQSVAILTLHNRTSGQTITVHKDCILGRKPSINPELPIDTIKIADSTRTVSRNHAAIYFDDQGRVLVEDLNSMNGTYIIEKDHEIQASAGNPQELRNNDLLRIGDEFYDVTVQHRRRN